MPQKPKKKIMKTKISQDWLYYKSYAYRVETQEMQPLQKTPVIYIKSVYPLPVIQAILKKVKKKLNNHNKQTQ